MKNAGKILGILLGILIGASVIEASQTCNRADFLCFESGPTANLLTPFRVDSSGNLTTLGNTIVNGTIATPSNIIQGVSGSAVLSATTAPNTSLTFPLVISTNVVAGAVIIAAGATTGNPSSPGGLYATTTGATTVLGVADAAASSGTVVNIDYSGIGVVLTTGAVAVGDLLVSSNSSISNIGGLAGTNNSASAGTIIGTALSANTSAASPSLTRVLLHH